jgi:DNA replication protein DnaC
MLQEPMMEKLTAMRLVGMVDALKAQEQDPASRELSSLERLGLLVDHQWNWRENQALARRLYVAKLKGNACVEEIDYRTARGLDKSVVRALAQKSAWVANHENIFVLGPTGVGKSFVACALAQKACRDGYSALYTRAAALFRDLAIARADGSLRNLLVRLSRIDVLVLDDWAMAPLAEAERRDFWEICEDRYQTRSTILTAQLPIARWHGQIGDPTAADGILDRLAHNAHRIEMRGDSIRNVARSRRANARRGFRGLSGEKGCRPFPRTPFSAIQAVFDGEPFRAEPVVAVASNAVIDCAERYRREVRGFLAQAARPGMGGFNVPLTPANSAGLGTDERQILSVPVRPQRRTRWTRSSTSSAPGTSIPALRARFTFSLSTQRSILMVKYSAGTWSKL